MNTPLSEWIEANPIREEMSFIKSAYAQFDFVRRTLARIIGEGLPWRERDHLVTVISTHRSKSIVLPVYRMQRPNADFYLRDNFHNWKLSVLAERPIDVDLSGLCHTTPPIEPDYTGNPLNQVYFEGFPPEVVFGYYEQNRQRWSAEFNDGASLTMALFLVARALGYVQPFKWNTRESHRAQLAAERVEWEASRAKDGKL